MKTHLIPLIALSLAMVSCTNSSGGMSRGVVGAGIGGLLGSILGDNLLSNNNNNNNAGAAAGAAAGGNNGGGGFLEDNQGLVTGAVAGYAAGAITDAMAKNEVRQRYLDGYNKGRSDAIKDLYWVKRDAERPNSDSAVQRRYYEVPVPEHVTTDGVLIEPRKVVIEVVE